MGKRAAFILLVALVLLGGGAVIAATQLQQWEHAAARDAYEASLETAGDARAAAVRSMGDEDRARAELSETLETGAALMPLIAEERLASLGVLGAAEQAGKLLAEPREKLPEAPAEPVGSGKDDYLRAAADVEAEKVELAGAADRSRARAAQLNELGNRLYRAWGAVARETQIESEAALDAGPNASTEARDAITAISASLGDESFKLTAQNAALWQSLPSALSRMQEEEAAFQAALVAAEAAARRGGAGGGGGSFGGGGGSGGGSGGSGGATASEAGGVLGASNAHRADNGLDALGYSGALVSSACTWASRLASSDSGLSHSSFPGGFGRWGENVASGYGSAGAVVNGWMNSAGHRANILNPSFSYMGACVAQGASGTLYWVQQFGG